MRGLGKLVSSFLFAAPWPPQTPEDLLANFRQLFLDLEQPAKISRQVSPTLRFNYVSPPQADGSSTWRTPNLEEASSTAPAVDSIRPPTSTEKPIAIYIPGLDGYGISAALHQFDDLASTFEFWRLFEHANDRSSFVEIVATIVEFVEELVENDENETTRDVVLIGESCGGVLAAAAALKLGEKANSPLKGLVLVNPATSFLRSPWESVIPALTALESAKVANGTIAGVDELPSAYGVLGSLLLSFLIPDLGQLTQIGQLILDLPDLDIPPTLEQSQSLVQTMVRAFRRTEERLPGELLEHRIKKWLTVGAPLVNNRLADITVPALVVVGERDVLLPSAEESERLVSALPLAEKLVAKDRGHLVLDSSVNLTEAILYSNIDPLNWKGTQKKYDPISDWKMPQPTQIQSTIERSVKPLITAHSPVFFSTDKRGKRWRGLSKFPAKKGPILIVANHQLYALDLRLIFHEMYQQLSIIPRGLAHPLLFAFGQNVSEFVGRTPGLAPAETSFLPSSTSDFQAFGAVQVTPRNYYRLMQTNQTAILFPGGIRESLTARKDYPLLWPDTVDFVRTAARFNATIVTLGAVGMADSVTTFVESEDVYRIPFLSDALLENINLPVRNARFNMLNEQEKVFPSIVAPSAPARNYFLFGKPVDLSNIDHNDLRVCGQTYQDMRAELRQSIDDLLVARKKDPFRDTASRLFYERVFGRQAPTFSVDDLNR